MYFHMGGMIAYPYARTLLRMLTCLVGLILSQLEDLVLDLCYNVLQGGRGTTSGCIASSLSRKIVLPTMYIAQQIVNIYTLLMS